jgi:hypothetical protein
LSKRLEKQVKRELARQADYNLHTFFQKLRKNEKEGLFEVHKRVVSKKRVKVSQIPDVR